MPSPSFLTPCSRRRFAWARVAVLAGWVLGAPGCTTWQGRPGVLTQTLDEREQVVLWVQGRGHQVHGVRVRGDSVTAVSFIRPPDCDSCAMRFVLRDVDSVQVQAFELRRSIVGAVILAPVLYGFYMLSQMPKD